MVSPDIVHEPMHPIPRVWLILAKVRAVENSNSAALVVGSEALVQCFIPVDDLDAAKSECTELLRHEGYQLEGVEKCVEFKADEEYPDAPEFVMDDVNKARIQGKAMTGTFFTAKDSASFQKPTEE